VRRAARDGQGKLCPYEGNAHGDSRSLTGVRDFFKLAARRSPGGPGFPSCLGARGTTSYCAG